MGHSQNLYISVKAVENHGLNTRDVIVNEMRALGGAVEAASERQTQQEASFHRTQQDPVKRRLSGIDVHTISPTATKRHSAESTQRLSTSRSAEKPTILGSSLRTVGSLTMSLKLTQKSCELRCTCACHRGSRFKSPDFLNNVLGSLLVGYQASPWTAQTCDNAECRHRSK